MHTHTLWHEKQAHASLQKQKHSCSQCTPSAQKESRHQLFRGTSSGRVRFERCTKFAKADIQMVRQKKRKKKKSQTGRRERFEYNRCRVWIGRDWHCSEIAPFLGASVYFVSVSLCISYTWLGHFIASPTPSPRTPQTPRGRRMFEWVSQDAQQGSSLHATATGPSLHRCSHVLSADPAVSPSSSSYRQNIPAMWGAGW